jgi:hypothetical protein
MPTSSGYIIARSTKADHSLQPKMGTPRASVSGRAIPLDQDPSGPRALERGPRDVSPLIARIVDGRYLPVLTKVVRHRLLALAQADARHSVPGKSDSRSARNGGHPGR